MQIVFLIKPNSINMYSCKDDLYTFLGNQDILKIENENHEDYENRMIYVCKDICQDFLNTDIYKENNRKIQEIKVILTSPWCVYEIMNIEKKLDKPQKINQDFIDKLILHKNIDNISILKNTVLNISLNEYDIKEIKNQSAGLIKVQYINIYTSTNFLNRITKILETIFHIHKINIDSIYSHIEHVYGKTEDNQLKIIIEDFGFDISYVYENKNISTLFIKSSYLDIRNKLKVFLHVDDNILDKILKSKFTPDLNNKSLNNIWSDLDSSVKIKIDQILNDELEMIKKQIRNFIDSIGIGLIKKDTDISIYYIDNVLLSNFDLIFKNSINQDAYILNKLLTTESKVFTKKIF